MGVPAYRAGTGDLKMDPPALAHVAVAPWVSQGKTTPRATDVGTQVSSRQISVPSRGPRRGGMSLALYEKADAEGRRSAQTTFDP